MEKSGKRYSRKVCGIIKMGDNSASARTDSSSDMDGDAKLDDGQHLASGGGNSNDSSLETGTKNGDSKVLRRLAQNREAARKSRLRKKAYVQQLESSRIKLNQLEQELQRTRQQQGLYLGPGSYSDQNGQSGGVGGANAYSSAGAAAFDLEYARWVEDHTRQMSELRVALQAHVADADLRLLVDGSMAHYDDLFRLKDAAAKADVFHLVSGMWKTPAERCFVWIGGCRPSELLKILVPQIEPLTEQQLLNICNLQQSSQQGEEALSQGMEQLQQSLAETLSAGSLGSAANVANYMGQMAVAMGQLGNLEGFVRQIDYVREQADHLRQQTLQQMHRVLTIRQVARGLLAMGDYFARLRALSSLWSARPRE
uniref:BZIP domain-containing protein n=1 Tax=Physcomitrium patens TaxID=3218 RepID=A0A7I4AX82_PHYPA